MAIQALRSIYLLGYELLAQGRSRPHPTDGNEPVASDQATARRRAVPLNGFQKILRAARFKATGAGSSAQCSQEWR